MSIPQDDHIAEPGYPAPWTTSTPREGLRDTDQARIISLAPDVCRSPSVPVPYPVVDFCGHDRNYTRSVRFTGQRAMVMRSHTRHVHGDEPGVGKGVVSGTVGGISEPITHAAQVRAEGSHVIRHLDRFHMNNRNTVGEAVFIRDTRTFPAPKDDDPLPGSLRLADASGNWAQYAAQPATSPSTPATRPSAPAPRPPGQAIRPDIPQWRRPPPTSLAREGLGPRLLRWGKWATRLHPVLMVLEPIEMGDGTLPGWSHDLRSSDPFRRRTAEEAQHRYFGNPALRPELEEWYRDETGDRPQAAPAEEAAARARSIPYADNVRVDEDEERPRCPVKRITFDIHGDPVEFSRQIEEQQERLNRMPVSDYMQRRAPIAPGAPGRAAELARRRRASLSHQLEARIQYVQQNEWHYVNLHGQKAWNDHLSSLAATHELDLIAGGYEHEISGMGGAAENSSIGPQWTADRRSGALDRHAAELARNGCPMMRVDLVAQ